MSTTHHLSPPAGPARDAGAATDLLGLYAPGDHTRFFAGPTRTLLATGTAARVPHGARPLADRVEATLCEQRETGRQEHPLVIGAVPFDSTGPAALAVPESVAAAPPLTQDPLTVLPVPGPATGGHRIREVPETPEYRDAVLTAVKRMRAGELSRAVLARTLEIAQENPVDVPALLQRLARRDPDGYTFAVPSAPGRTLLGAGPELLVARRGGQVVANPLAGSVPRGDDLGEDARRAAGLLESAKARHEHALVVHAVRRNLEPFCATLDVPAEPTLVRTPAMWHLSTTVTGDLAEPAASALELAMALHPTPAVCGTPTPEARALIRELEPFDRGLFTGVVGWGDAEGNGEWVVTNRCADAGEHDLRLYAGAGVVAASSPWAEADGTGAKFTSFLDAVGVEL